MSRVAWLFKHVSAAAVCGLVALAASAAAHADPCVQECRGQHNACRMTTKMLSSPGCDAQLQSCITRCFHRGGPSMGREPPGREPFGRAPFGRPPFGREPPGHDRGRR